MRFDTQQPRFYCGLDLHARSMSVCSLNQDGESLWHRNMNARPEMVLKAIAPSREEIVVSGEGLFTWDWLADLGAQAAIPLVLGHALDMNALQGGQATHDTLDAHQMAVWRRGGLRPQAYVYPAAMRAPRARLRRRMSLPRKRAERLAHLQHTHSQDHLPEMGKKLADKANRAGVAARFPAPAGQQRMAVELTRLGASDPLRSELEWHLVNAAQPHAAHTLYRLQTGPGMGNILRLVLRDEIPDLRRVPSGQDVRSYRRLVTWARASAGTRDGPAGAKMGNAELKWACAAAAGLFLRANPAGQKSVTPLENKHGQGKAWTRLAPKLGRTVYDRLKRPQAFEMHTLLQAECAEWVSLTPHWTCPG